MPELHPRTHLFALSTFARARALHPDTPEAERSALLELAFEAGETGHHCYPGGLWDRSNLKVVCILGDFERDADAARLPRFDLSDPAAFLLDAAVTELRNMYADRPGRVAEVQFTAHPFGSRIEWGNITHALTRYNDGTERDNISYPCIRLDYFLNDLADLRRPATGDTLTLRVAPGPSALPVANDDFDLLGWFGLGDEVPALIELESAPDPEPERAPEPVKSLGRLSTPALDDATGWVWWHVDRKYVAGTVTRLHFINNGGRSKLTVRVLDGTHKGMAPTINRHITDDLITDAHAYAKATYGARRLWPTHFCLERPALVPAAS
ncbi:hypothetical protein AB0I69_42725 [Streptomyces sp. NPDC050508]|uniref:hypothetical protein n=1 Tax=Streptomyces sp. NPDC050508 TaxID=3155405 RepID=UPI00341360D9